MPTFHPTDLVIDRAVDRIKCRVAATTRLHTTLPEDLATYINVGLTVVSDKVSSALSSEAAILRRVLADEVDGAPEAHHSLPAAPLRDVFMEKGYRALGFKSQLPDGSSLTARMLSPTWNVHPERAAQIIGTDQVRPIVPRSVSAAIAAREAGILPHLPDSAFAVDDFWRARLEPVSDTLMRSSPKVAIPTRDDLPDAVEWALGARSQVGEINHDIPPAGSKISSRVTDIRDTAIAGILYFGRSEHTRNRFAWDQVPGWVVTVDAMASRHGAEHFMNHMREEWLTGKNLMDKYTRWEISSQRLNQVDSPQAWRWMLAQADPQAWCLEHYSPMKSPSRLSFIQMDRFGCEDIIGCLADRAVIGDERWWHGTMTFKKPLG